MPGKSVPIHALCHRIDSRWMENRQSSEWFALVIRTREESSQLRQYQTTLVAPSAHTGSGLRCGCLRPGTTACLGVWPCRAPTGKRSPTLCNSRRCHPYSPPQDRFHRLRSMPSAEGDEVPRNAPCGGPNGAGIHGLETVTRPKQCPAGDKKCLAGTRRKFVNLCVIGRDHTPGRFLAVFGRGRELPFEFVGMDELSRHDVCEHVRRRFLPACPEERHSNTRPGKA